MQRQKFFLKRYFSSFLAYHFAIKRLLLPAFLLMSALLAEPYQKGKLRAVSTHINIRLQVSSYKRYSTIKKQSPLWGIHHCMTESPSTLSWCSEILKLRKGLHIREGGIKDIWCIAQFDAAIVSLSQNLVSSYQHTNIKRHSHKCTLNLSPYIPKASKRRYFFLD